MTEWGLIAAIGIPVAFIMGAWVVVYWRGIGKEPKTLEPKLQTHEIMFLEERKRRMKSCGR